MEVRGYFGGGEDVVAVLSVCEIIVAEVGSVNPISCVYLERVREGEHTQT